MNATEAIAVLVRNCEACPLHRRRLNAVPGAGPSDAEVMMIGEAPGANEDVQGRPFVGRSGRLLDEILDRCGFDRAELYVTNLVKCRPDGNRSPRRQERSACAHFLEAELDAVGSSWIVTLGREALQFFAPGTAITEAHGTRYGYDQGQTLYPTFHPAAALRRTAWREALEQDLAKLHESIEEER